MRVRRGPRDDRVGGLARTGTIPPSVGVDNLSNAGVEDGLEEGLGGCMGVQGSGFDLLN